MKIKIKVFYKLVILCLLAIARHAQSTQNSILTSLQYLEKEGRDEVDFLHANKQTILHQTILQGDTINIGVMAQPARITQNSKFAKSLHGVLKPFLPFPHLWALSSTWANPLLLPHCSSIHKCPPGAELSDC